ncbi:hypothetical protein EI555_005912, partial [Monodon monoceros]
PKNAETNYVVEETGKETNPENPTPPENIPMVRRPDWKDELGYLVVFGDLLKLNKQQIKFSQKQRSYELKMKITEEDASAHETQGPERGQLRDQFLKPGFPQTRRKDLKDWLWLLPDGSLADTFAKAKDCLKDDEVCLDPNVQQQRSAITNILWIDHSSHSSEKPLQLHSKAHIPPEILN